MLLKKEQMLSSLAINFLKLALSNMVCITENDLIAYLRKSKLATKVPGAIGGMLPVQTYSMGR